VAAVSNGSTVAFAALSDLDRRRKTEAERKEIRIMLTTKPLTFFKPDPKQARQHYDEADDR
jgi:hypothetical protein